MRNASIWAGGVENCRSRVSTATLEIQSLEEKERVSAFIPTCMWCEKGKIWFKFYTEKGKIGKNIYIINRYFKKNIIFIR